MDKASEAMASTLGRWPTMDEVAEYCELTTQEISDAARLSRIGDPRSLDESFESHESDDGSSLSDYVGYEDEGFNVSLDRLTLATAFDTLLEREKTILRLRYYSSLSQRQTAEIVSISQMHVSRLERAARNKLRLVLQHNPNRVPLPDRISAVAKNKMLSAAS